MEDKRLARVKEIHRELLSFAQAWASKKEVDLSVAAQLRQEVILLNHERYFEMIPVYRTLAEDMGTPSEPDMNFIAEELVSTDDVFKSYNPAYLEQSAFDKMNQWLSTIHTGDIQFETDRINTISGWIEGLAGSGVHSTFSSGTTGRLSFVPRDDYNWECFMNTSAAYIPFLFDGLQMNYENFDAFSLSFRGGNMGVGLVGQRISRYARNAYFLYDAEISPDALRVIRKGASNETEQKLLDDYYAMILSNTEEKFDFFISKLIESTQKHRRAVKIFGAPFQLKQLCERMLAGHGGIELLHGSTLSFGGGWKTFEGEKIDRPQLIDMVRNAFGIEEKYIFEGYSMTEMNISFMRCPGGRYHLPPLIEPIIYDEALLPLQGDDVTGIFGYLDPFATSYPGFIISGDVVHMVHETCPCGRTGPAIVGDVSRAPGREVKGCGGIMGDMKA